MLAGCQHHVIILQKSSLSVNCENASSGDFPEQEELNSVCTMSGGYKKDGLPCIHTV